MNKKEAISYAQIALEDMNRENNTNLSLASFAVKMKSAFRYYDRQLAVSIAEAKMCAEKKVKEVIGDTNGRK